MSINPVANEKMNEDGRVDVEWRVSLPFGAGSLVFKSKGEAEAACAAINAWLAQLDGLLLQAHQAHWESPKEEDEDEKSRPQTEPIHNRPASTNNAGVPVIHDLAGAMATISIILFLTGPAFKMRDQALEALERFANKWREVEAEVRRQAQQKKATDSSGMRI